GLCRPCSPMAEPVLRPFATPSRHALSVDDHPFTQGDVGDLCARYRAFLSSMEIRPGDRVALWTDPHPLTPIALLANVMYGVVSIPRTPGLAPAETDHILRDADPKVVLAPDPDPPRSGARVITLTPTSPPGSTHPPFE